jgi:hypothetical protein
MDALWQRTLLVLDAFARSQPVPTTGGHPDLSPGGSTTTGQGMTLTGRPDLFPGGRARGAFWKRSDRG